MKKDWIFFTIEGLLLVLATILSILALTYNRPQYIAQAKLNYARAIAEGESTRAAVSARYYAEHARIAAAPYAIEKKTKSATPATPDIRAKLPLSGYEHPNVYLAEKLKGLTRIKGSVVQFNKDYTIVKIYATGSFSGTGEVTAWCQIYGKEEDIPVLLTLAGLTGGLSEDGLTAIPLMVWQGRFALKRPCEILEINVGAPRTGY